MEWNSISQMNFIYRMKNTYNYLPKNLTLSPNKPILKKWMKKINFNKDTKIPNREHNTHEDLNIYIQRENSYKCEN